MRSNAIRLALVAAVVLLLCIPGSARAAAGPAQRYNQDLISAGRDIDLHPGDTVRRDVVCLGCSIALDGASVGGDVVAAGGSVTITDGRVGRDVAAYGGSVALRGRATVAGAATATGGGLSVKDEARVGGDASAPALASAAVPGVLTFWTLGSLAPALGFVLLSLVLLWVFPRQVLATGRLAEQRPAASFGLGCLGVVVAAALAVLFAVTVVLLPVSFLLLLGLVAAWVLGWTGIFVAAGGRLISAVRRGAGDELPALLVGGVVVSVLWVIPIVNVLVGILGGCIAIGAALGTRFGTRGPGNALFSPGFPPAATPPTPPAA